MTNNVHVRLVFLFCISVGQLQNYEYLSKLALMRELRSDQRRLVSNKYQAQEGWGEGGLTII